MSIERNLRIIVIDDNPSIHQDFIKILSARAENEISDQATMLENVLFDEDVHRKKEKVTLPNFEIDTACQGKEGVDMIAKAIKDKKPYALAFVDIRMPPGWDGIETIQRIWELDSNIEVVICTAFSDYSWEQTVEKLGHKDNLLILKKPFDNVAVRQLACALTKKWQLVQQAKEYTYTLEDKVVERTKSLSKSLSLMRATLESSADGIMVVDKDGKIKDYNNKIVKLLKIPKTVLSTNDFYALLEFLTPQLKNDFVFEVAKLTHQPNKETIGTLNFHDKRIFEYYTQPYKMNDEIVGRVWSFRDVTKRAFLEEELQYQATHDLLTGLPNRVYLLDRIRQSMVKADSNKRGFAVLFLDIDRFKLINDSFNHEIGDEVLKMVAERLQSLLKKEDTLVRLGGDEFVIVIEGLRKKSAIDAFCHKIQNLFNQPFVLYQYELTLSVSIGITLYPNNGDNIESLLHNADVAMYHAKELGAHQFQYFTEELNRKNHEKLQKETELRRALARGEFYLHYQPQFDLKSRKFVSVEALIRWRHPERGEILPLEFIPLAEESGLIVPIGEWVLRTACKQIKEWHDQGLPHIRVAVNITTKQFRLFDLTTMIANILNETGLEPKYLELELTETVIINNLDVINTIHALKRMGVHIALDDFGTGYSSLNYLRQIPVDRLKIDQSYVQNIESNRGDDVIIQAIISMAKNLNLEVIAEGVETQKQLDFLRQQKCGEVQGFYFSKPLSPKDCENLLRNGDEIKFQDIV